MIARGLLAATMLAALGTGYAMPAWARTNSAVLMAVTAYPNLPPKNALIGPNHDAKLVRDYLTTRAPIKFEPADVTLLADRVVRHLDDLPAFVADRKGRHVVPVVVRLGAGDEGVEALQPVDEAALDQRVERPVDLQRRAESLLAQLVEQRVGAERAGRSLQPFENADLVPGQRFAGSHGSTSIVR